MTCGLTPTSRFCSFAIKTSVDQVAVPYVSFIHTLLQMFTYPCPCGDRFQITVEDLEDGEEVLPPLNLALAACSLPHLPSTSPPPLPPPPFIPTDSPLPILFSRHPRRVCRAHAQQLFIPLLAHYFVIFITLVQLRSRRSRCHNIQGTGETSAACSRILSNRRRNRSTIKQTK
jgi:hypothetical protein